MVGAAELLPSRFETKSGEGGGAGRITKTLNGFG